MTNEEILKKVDMLRKKYDKASKDLRDFRSNVGRRIREKNGGYDDFLFDEDLFLNWVKAFNLNIEYRKLIVLEKKIIRECQNFNDKYESVYYENIAKEENKEIDNYLGSYEDYLEKDHEKHDISNIYNQLKVLEEQENEC